MTCRQLGRTSIQQWLVIQEPEPQSLFSNSYCVSLDELHRLYVPWRCSIENISNNELYLHECVIEVPVIITATITPHNRHTLLHLSKTFEQISLGKSNFLTFISRPAPVVSCLFISQYILSSQGTSSTPVSLVILIWLRFLSPGQGHFEVSDLPVYLLTQHCNKTFLSFLSICVTREEALSQETSGRERLKFNPFGTELMTLFSENWTFLPGPISENATIVQPSP